MIIHAKSKKWKFQDVCWLVCWLVCWDDIQKLCLFVVFEMINKTWQFKKIIFYLNYFNVSLLCCLTLDEFAHLQVNKMQWFRRLLKNICKLGHILNIIFFALFDLICAAASVAAMNVFEVIWCEIILPLFFAFPSLVAFSAIPSHVKMVRSKLKLK